VILCPRSALLFPYTTLFRSVFGALLVDAADRVLGLRLGGVAVVSVGEDRVPVAVPAAGGGAVCEPCGVADGGGELLTGPRVFARGDVDGGDPADGLLGAGEDGGGGGGDLVGHGVSVLGGWGRSGGEAEGDGGVDQFVGDGLPGGVDVLGGDGVVADVAAGRAGGAGAAGAGGLVDLAVGAGGVVGAGAGGGDDAGVLDELGGVGDLVGLVAGGGLAGGGADLGVAAGAVAGAQCAGAGERAAAAGAAGGGFGGVVHGPPP